MLEVRGWYEIGLGGILRIEGFLPWSVEEGLLGFNRSMKVKNTMKGYF